MGKISISKRNTLTGHRDCIYTLEGTRNRESFFSGSGDGMVVKWDLNDPENGQLIAKLPNSIYGLHLHEPTDLLVVGHNYDGIHVINWQEKKEVASLKMTDASIFDIKSLDDFLFVSDSSGTISVINFKNLKIVHRLKDAQKSARCIALNPEKREMAVGFSDNIIRVYSLGNFELKHELEGHTNSVFTVTYSPDLQLLLSAGRDAHLKSWDVGAGYNNFHDIVAHMYAINHIEYSPDGKHFVTCSMDKSIKVWDAKAFKLLKVIDKSRHAGHGTSVNKLFWSNYDNLLASASDDRTISIWDVILN